MVECQAMSESGEEETGPNYTKQNLKDIRKTLRFSLSDRVICNCGPLWLPGSVVGTAVESDGELFPYLVKTDPIPGMPSRTWVGLWDPFTFSLIGFIRTLYTNIFSQRVPKANQGTISVPSDSGQVCVQEAWGGQGF